MLKFRSGSPQRIPQRIPLHAALHVTPSDIERWIIGRWIIGAAETFRTIRTISENRGIRAGRARSRLVLLWTRLIWIGLVSLATSPALAQKAGDEEKLLIVPIDKSLGASVVEGIERRVRAKIASDTSFTTVVFRWNVTGGDAEACEHLARFIFQDLRRQAVTVAWLPEEVGPLGYGIAPFLACKRIVLGPGTALAAFPEEPAPGAAPPDFPDFLRSEMNRHADHFRRPSLLVHAFLASDHDDLHRVEFGKESDRRTLWNDGDKSIDFLTAADFNKLDPFDRRGKHEIICRRGRFLQVPVNKARAWMLSEYAAFGNVLDLLTGLELFNVRRGNVIDLKKGALEKGPVSGQSLIDFFQHPLVRALLIFGGCLGLLIEFKMLGAMFPAGFGLLCFFTLFLTSIYPVTGAEAGTATWWEIVLFFLGIGLLSIEILLLPGVAVFAISGGALCLVSLVMAMVPDEVGATQDTMTVRSAIETLILGFGIGTLGFMVLVRSLPKGRFFAGGIVNTTRIEGVPMANSTIESQIENSHLIGRLGRSETPLRPAGKILLDDGRVLDVVSDGEFLERGVRVVVRESSSLRTVVIRADESSPDGPAPDGPAEPSSDRSES